MTKRLSTATEARPIQWGWITLYDMGKIMDRPAVMAVRPKAFPSSLQIALPATGLLPLNQIQI